MSFRSVVVDTNVVVAGLLTGDAASPAARLLDGMLTGGFVFLLSPALLAEYRTVLLRPAIRERHGLGEDEIDAILTEVVANATVREPPPAGAAAPEPGDQHLWDLVASERGTVLVTGDADLLGQPPEGHGVVSPATLLDRIPL